MLEICTFHQVPHACQFPGCSPHSHTAGLTSSCPLRALQAPSLRGPRSKVKSEGVTEEEEVQGPLCGLLPELAPHLGGGEVTVESAPATYLLSEKRREFEGRFVRAEVWRNSRPVPGRDEVRLSKAAGAACQAEGVRRCNPEPAAIN